MKKFLLRLLVFLPLLLLVAGINYYQDPGNLFKAGQYERDIFKYLQQGKNVTNITNYDERYLQQLYIADLHQAPDILVLGSSKTMMVDQSMFPGKKILNSSLSGGSMEDMLAVFELLEERNLIPSEVIIGIDPWLWNEHHGMMRWRSLAGPYKKMLHKLQLPARDIQEPDVWEKNSVYLELFSLSYFQQSFVDFSRGVKTFVEPSNDAVNVMATKRPDGSYMYESSYRDRTPEIVQRNAEGEISMTVKGFHDFTKLSPRYQQIFEKFMLRLKQKGVKITLFLAPYHPLMYEHFKNNSAYKMVFTADNYFRSFAGQQGIRVFGDMNPAVFGLENDDFYDGVHCDIATITSLMQQLNQTR